MAHVRTVDQHDNPDRLELWLNAGEDEARGRIAVTVSQRPSAAAATPQLLSELLPGLADTVLPDVTAEELAAWGKTPPLPCCVPTAFVAETPPCGLPGCSDEAAQPSAADGQDDGEGILMTSPLANRRVVLLLLRSLRSLWIITTAAVSKRAMAYSCNPDGESLLQL